MSSTALGPSIHPICPRKEGSVVGGGGGQVQAGVTCWRCPTAGRRLGSGEEGPQGAVEDSEQGAGETLW